MNQVVTQAIILSRTDYGEADRILTVLTPSYGKVTLLAKGVRRIKSKLAGGIELFSVSEITFIKGRKDISTLVSTRLISHYGNIVSVFDKTMLGYELLRTIHRVTEDEPEEVFFHLLVEVFEALNDGQYSNELIQFWFGVQLLRISGHSPNLELDEQGNRLASDVSYDFGFDHMAFVSTPQREGHFTANHIKFLRLAFTHESINVLYHVRGGQLLIADTAPLIQTMLATFLKV